MKTFLTGLVYDKEMISKLKKASISKELLYNGLISGKISLKEYLQMSK